ncbi:hypothetical protein [Cryobacterium sp. PH31-L1]|nr:hypothetical protein [Cryobacterium sp. PH31-L1]MDJ0379076.1 hypothetical protein [Cryobacterium sp. PH31-L1]
MQRFLLVGLLAMVLVAVPVGLWVRAQTTATPYPSATLEFP